MYKGLRVAAVVPAHNEERLIGQTISTMPKFVDFVVVIDDGSADDTAKRAVEAGDPRVILIEHQTNMGVGAAIIDGHRMALDLGADVNVVMAGDAQMDPHYLPALLDPIADKGCGFTKANRFYSREALAGMPVIRIAGNIVLSFATKMASGYWNLFDPQNGYTAITRDALGRIDLDRVARGYSFENDLLVRLGIADVQATDVQVPARYGTEVSGMKLHRVIPEISRLLFVGFWRRIVLKYVLMSFSPIALLLFTGLFLCVLGATVGLWAIIVTPSGKVPSTGTALLATGPLLVGINMLVHALSLDIQQTPAAASPRPAPRLPPKPVAPASNYPAANARPSRSPAEQPDTRDNGGLGTIRAGEPVPGAGGGADAAGSLERAADRAVPAGRAGAGDPPVRAENLVRGSGQQGRSPVLRP